MQETDSAVSTKNKSRLSFSLDYRILILALLSVIVAMLFIWKPWSSAGTTDRTINVSGEAKVTAEPDLFLFYPTYDFKNADADLALSAATQKSNEVAQKLKELGVADSKIKTNVDSYDFYSYYDEESEETTYTLRLSVEVTSREEAQKIQDYLVSTSPSGSISPQGSFSDSKRKELENKARDEATKDARARAEQSAKNLGFKLGKVKSVEDNGFQGGVYYGSDLSQGSSEKEGNSRLTIQPGENELSYSVGVIYFVR